MSPMPEPDDLIAAFSPQPGRCFRTVQSRQLQATHCRREPAWKGIWTDVGGNGWYGSPGGNTLRSHRKSVLNGPPRCLRPRRHVGPGPHQAALRVATGCGKSGCRRRLEAFLAHRTALTDRRGRRCSRPWRVTIDVALGVV